METEAQDVGARVMMMMMDMTMVKEEDLMKDLSSANCMSTVKDYMMKKMMNNGTVAILNATNWKREKLLVMPILNQIVHVMVIYASSIRKTDTVARELV